MSLSMGPWQQSLPRQVATGFPGPSWSPAPWLVKFPPFLLRLLFLTVQSSAGEELPRQEMPITTLEQPGTTAFPWLHSQARGGLPTLGQRAQQCGAQDLVWNLPLPVWLQQGPCDPHVHVLTCN